MRALLATLLLCLTFGLITAADARSRHHYYPAADKSVSDTWRNDGLRGDFFGSMAPVPFAMWSAKGRQGKHWGGGGHAPVASGYGHERPSDCYGIPWCGCWLKHALSAALSAADRALNLNRAIEWARVGRPASPHVGAVVVWRHHVGTITGRDGNGEWVVTSGNDGHRVRTRARSIAGAVAIRDVGVTTF